MATEERYTIGRVRSRAAWLALRASRCRARAGPIKVTFATVADADRPLVAFAVGRKVGSAVVRNRIRRRLRDEASRHDLKPGAYLITVAPGAARIESPELRRDLDRALQTLPEQPR